MLNNIIRFYNQNRKKVWNIVLVIAFAIILLQALNYYAKTNKNNNLERGDSSTQDAAIYQPSRSLVTGDKVSEKTFTKQYNIVNSFIENCNEGKPEEAYSLLSDDCKNLLFPSLESFINNYYNLTFNKKRTYSMENWTQSTYRINMTEDILATGKSNNGIATQDYFTIVSQNGELKLNICKFIGSEELNKEKKDSNLQIKVLKRYKYMDYETYDIEAKNISGQKMLLDSLEQTDSIYITDKTGIKHPSYSNEIPENLLEIDSGLTTKLSIKFSNPYISNREIKSITFSDICKIKEEQTEFYGVLEYKDVTSLTIDL